MLGTAETILNLSNLFIQTQVSSGAGMGSQNENFLHGARPVKAELLSSK